MTARSARGTARSRTSGKKTGHRPRARPRPRRPDHELRALIMRLARFTDLSIRIVPMGKVGDAMPAFHALETRIPIRYDRADDPPLDAVERGRDHGRDQWRAAEFIRRVKQENGKSLAVTHLDIFDDPKNFVFGLAETDGHGAVISTARLKHVAKTLFYIRIRKEAVHEIGHMLGLHHCPSAKCVMFFSKDIRDTDKKGDWYCQDCCLSLEEKYLLAVADGGLLRGAREEDPANGPAPGL